MAPPIQLCCRAPWPVKSGGVPTCASWSPNPFYLVPGKFEDRGMKVYSGFTSEAEVFCTLPAGHSGRHQSHRPRSVLDQYPVERFYYWPES